MYISQLNNGLRVLHIQHNSPVSHFGILINTGTRDELQNENGCAHLVEHSLFKGTSNRSAKSLALGLDNIGADINAYTTKEDTCVHVSFLSEYYPRIMDIFADMLFYSTFPEKEICKEINVIKEEIMSCFDSPSEVIYDDFENFLFTGHSLGRNILGTAQTLDVFANNLDIVRNFFSNNYLNNEIVLWSDGNLSEKKFMSLCDKYFGNSPLKTHSRERQHVTPYVGFDKVVDRDDVQCNVVMGGRAFSSYEKGRDAFTLLNHILGSDAISSRLNDKVREKRGLVYQIESSYTPYCDTGIFSIFYECEYDAQEKVNSIIRRELNKLKDNRMGSLQLGIAKKRLKGYIAVAADSRLNDAISSAKSLSVFNKVDDLKTVFRRIDAITEDDMLEVANVVFDENNLSQLIYRPQVS